MVVVREGGRSESSSCRASCDQDEDGCEAPTQCFSQAMPSLSASSRLLKPEVNPLKLRSVANQPTSVAPNRYREQRP